jgi:hypothetical protein
MSASSEASEPSASAAAGDTAVGDPALACAAIPDFDATLVVYPGNDPDMPPSAADLAAWAATAVAPLQIMADNLPADLHPDVATVQAAVASAAQGTPMDTEDQALLDALAALDKSAIDNCGFPTLEVSASATELAGVPATLPAGPVSVAFADDSGEAQAVIFLMWRVREGEQVDLAAVRDNTLDLQTVADIVAAVPRSAGGGTAYSTVIVTPGHYIVASPLGLPPGSAGILAEALDIT